MKYTSIFKIVFVLALVGCQKPIAPYTPDNRPASDMRASIASVGSHAGAIVATAQTQPTPPEIAPHAVAISVEATRMGQSLAQIEGEAAKAQKAIRDRDASLLAKDGCIQGKDKTITTLTSERDEAKARYSGAWLGGRAWAAIYWIAGICVALLIADALLPIGINPVWWIVKRITGKA